MVAGGRLGCGCVLFEKCIVDASIFIFIVVHDSFLSCAVFVVSTFGPVAALCGGGVVCRCCCKCLRAFGGCLGTRSR